MWHSPSMPRSDLISAALRHVRDAEHLLAPGPHRSVEQALHLVGFGPECARKACVDEAIADKALGHDIKGAGDVVVELLLALDPAASRYGLGGPPAALPHLARHWRPEHRYMATGKPEAIAPSVTAMVHEARAFVDGCVTELWCDGVLPAEGLQ